MRTSLLELRIKLVAVLVLLGSWLLLRPWLGERSLLGQLLWHHDLVAGILEGFESLPVVLVLKSLLGLILNCLLQQVHLGRVLDRTEVLAGKVILRCLGLRRRRTNVLIGVTELRNLIESFVDQFKRFVPRGWVATGFVVAAAVLLLLI